MSSPHDLMAALEADVAASKAAVETPSPEGLATSAETPAPQETAAPEPTSETPPAESDLPAEPAEPTPGEPEAAALPLDVAPVSSDPAILEQIKALQEQIAELKARPAGSPASATSAAAPVAPPNVSELVKAEVNERIKADPQLNEYANAYQANKNSITKLDNDISVIERDYNNLLAQLPEQRRRFGLSEPDEVEASEIRARLTTLKGEYFTAKQERRDFLESNGEIKKWAEGRKAQFTDEALGKHRSAEQRTTEESQIVADAAEISTSFQNAFVALMKENKITDKDVSDRIWNDARDNALMNPHTVGDDLRKYLEGYVKRELAYVAKQRQASARTVAQQKAADSAPKAPAGKAAVAKNSGSSGDAPDWQTDLLKANRARATGRQA